MSAVVEGAACRANISGPGRRRRATVSAVFGLISVGALVGAVVLGASWPWRLTIGLPAAAAAISGLQVRRNTCVAHAATGSFEHEDFTTTKVEAAFAEASRRVAATIVRDGVLLGLAVSAIAVLLP